jgi:hypothetical protein
MRISARCLPSEEPEDDHPDPRPRFAHHERLLGRRAKRDRSRRRADGRRCKHHQRVRHHGLRYHVALSGRLDEQIQVVLVPAEPLDERQALVDLQRGLDVGIEPHECLQQPHGEMARGRRRGEPQRSRGETAHPAQGALHRRERLEQLAAARIDRLPGFGELQPVADLLEEPQARRLAELLDLHRGGRLGHVQLLGGARAGAESRGGLERSQRGRMPCFR